ncbi:hypothetical protein HQN89_21850 [Paenibacillus frigoriresistens]|uniref:hypothetical protein n=1 Tax=Paenibacillus alginolyticus TaxID=59839 RepID=UPI0015655A71|nr:hypothetical protein [Paenibacillus frigoriresistens]NRF93591.1 hypothetical protein [Paenibacillus frigoriresistens]
MKLNIFYDTNRYLVDLEELVGTNQAPWNQFSDIQMYKLEDHVDPNEEFAVIYLINGTRSPSSKFLNHIAALREAGAHPLSIVIALNESNKLNNHEKVLVEQEVEAALVAQGWGTLQHKYLWVSTPIFSLYQTIMRTPIGIPDSELVMWDDEVNMRLSVHMVVERNWVYRMIRYSQIERLSEPLQRLLSVPELLIRKLPNKGHLYTYQVNKDLITRFDKEPNLSIHPVNYLETMNQYASSGDVLLCRVTYMDTDTSVLKQIELECSVIVLVDGLDTMTTCELSEHISELQKCYMGVIFIPFSQYTFMKLQGLESEAVTIPQLISDPLILIADRYGFPVPKSSVLNWNQALEKESGLERILYEINLATKKGLMKDAAAV